MEGERACRRYKAKLRNLRSQQSAVDRLYRRDGQASELYEVLPAVHRRRHLCPRVVIANEGMPFRVRIRIILRDVVRPVSPLFAAVVLFGLDLLGDFEVHNSKEPLPRFLMPGPGIKVKARRGHERSTGQALRLNHSHFQPCQDRTRLKKARRRANLRGVVCETHRIKLRTGQLRPDLTK